MLSKNRKKEIIDNLYSAGCSDEQVEVFIEQYEKGNKEEAMLILEKRRKEELEDWHRLESCIRCLDYLVYTIDNEKHDD